MLRRLLLAATTVGALTACGTAPDLRAAPPVTTQTATLLPTTLPPTTLPTGALPPTTLPTGALPTDSVPPGVGQLLGYRLVGRAEVLGVVGDQGLATVRRPDGTTSLVQRGDLDVTAALRAGGWDHVGDPGSWGGWVVDALQGRPGAIGLRATSPAGAETLGTVTGPTTSSFAAVTPDGQRTVTAQWGRVRTMLALPTPGVAAPAGELGPVTTVALDRPLDDLQGCAFRDPTTMVCDESAPPEVVAVHLDHAPSGPSVAATVTVLGPVPEQSTCAGRYEPEGVDVDATTGELRLEVIPPGGCALFTQVYEYLPS